MNNYKESYAPNKQQRSMLSTTKLQWSCHKNFSHYRAPIQDPTGQSQELCVKDQLLKYQLDPTVNIVETFILWNVCSVEKKNCATSIKHTRTPHIFIQPTTSFKHHSHTNRLKIGKITLKTYTLASLTWKKLAEYPDTQTSEYYRPQSIFTSWK